MENIICQLCQQFCDKPVLLQCNHLICSKCVQIQFSFELPCTPRDQFPLNTERKQKEGKQEIDERKQIIHDIKKTTNICCPKCNEKTILFFSQGDIKLANNQQVSAVNDGLGENKQQQYIPDEMLQWVFQFLNTKELFTKIRFTCNRVDKIVCTPLLSLHCQGSCINGMKFAREILPKETQLQELNLMLSNIGDNEATEIAAIFPLTEQLQILNLSWNKIGDTGAIAIAKSVKHLKQLQVLDISWNPIRRSGKTAISNATKGLTKFQKLDIYEKSFQTIYVRVRQVFDQKGTKLDLDYCTIDDACAISLAKILPHLSQLQGLRLGVNQIGEVGVTAIVNSIRNLTQLRGLGLSRNEIGGTCATTVANAISNLTQLQVLYLHYTQIGDTGATTIANSISNLTQLQELDLNDNQIGDIGATAFVNSISDLTQLQLLNFGGNQIRDTGAIAIANSLTNLTQLQELNLFENAIGDTGATAIANSISNLTSLNCLSLWKNKISEPVKLQLKQQFGDKLRIYNHYH